MAEQQAPPETFNAGDALTVPAGVIHAATYVVIIQPRQVETYVQRN